MPRQVDHDERRRLIGEAVLRVAAERGLEAASMREVATEAGVSVGLVQHYFASKDALVLFATGLLRERFERRVASAAAPSTQFDGIRAVLLAFLPLDGAGRLEALSGMAVFIRALNDPGLAGRYRYGRERIVAAVTERLDAAVAAGEAREDLDTELEAHALLAVVGGLVPDLLFGHLSSERALRIVDHRLGALSAGPDVSMAAR
ncbi:TetR/AcrR family transcriptional regulator [Actinomadura xylanilytica]|uniref:TetR/AcrR family transcriptional regulator n=1 Tax=Actinomadura xylanilytica TaxID=887459 RepID=UPI00255ACA16|nr:TetR family transcriptional regulator C-terminal domain-containing protein [Actinomadura xylanilytica]MDL4775394.1 TetR family transcriptional regulator C-terminal domain-containing protein [Actinomadura xylanilytica]